MMMNGMMMCSFYDSASHELCVKAVAPVKSAVQVPLPTPFIAP